VLAFHVRERVVVGWFVVVIGWAICGDSACAIVTDSFYFSLYIANDELIFSFLFSEGF